MSFAGPKESTEMRRHRNERLYSLLRAMREMPEPTSGVRVGLLSYNETRAYDAIVAMMDGAPERLERDAMAEVIRETIEPIWSALGKLESILRSGDSYPENHYALLERAQAMTRRLEGLVRAEGAARPTGANDAPSTNPAAAAPEREA